MKPQPEHIMQGPPGSRCSCGASFQNYQLLAEHVRLSIPCPRCGGRPVSLAKGELFRWQCGHWIACDDATATTRSNTEEGSVPC